MDTLNKKINEKRKQQLALLSVFTAFFLAVLKLIFSIITNSLTLLASSVDSIVDIFASLVNYFSIKESSKPPDNEHKFGHGKIESLAALFQALIILGSAFFIIYKSIESSINGTTLTQINDGIIVMIISSIISILLTYLLKRGAKKYKSQILKTDSLHYETDVYQNLGIVITMVIVQKTGLYIIDAIIAMIIGLYITYQVWKILKDAINSLMDHELPEDIRMDIAKTIMSHKKVKDFHNLRTRSAGKTFFIDVDIVLTPSITLKEANIIAHSVEANIHKLYPNAEVMIHADPFDDSHHDKNRQKKVYKH